MVGYLHCMHGHSELHVGVEVEKAANGPNGEHIPVACIRDGTCLVEDSLDTFLQYVCVCVCEGGGR